MNWSFSNQRRFRACQRQWYYQEVVASHAASDPQRRLAYELSKLQGLAAWRGTLIDSVLTDKVIPALNSRRLPSLDDTLANARQRFDAQVQFARAHRVHEKGMSPTKHRESFAAWHDIEYGEDITQSDLQICWNEIETCIQNFYGMSDVIAELRNAIRCIAQRPLSFVYNGITVKAVPDVIVFRGQRPPLIVDWKTYRSDSHDHWLQLACYAIALTRCNPHKDFPQATSHLSANAIQLLELQLLTNKKRMYQLSDDDQSDVENFIALSAHTMQLAIGDAPKKTIEPERFPVAQSPTTCQFCSFKRICWKGDACL